MPRFTSRRSLCAATTICVNQPTGQISAQSALCLELNKNLTELKFLNWNRPRKGHGFETCWRHLEVFQVHKLSSKCEDHLFNSLNTHGKPLTWKDHVAGVERVDDSVSHILCVREKECSNRTNMFLTNQQVNKAEVTILSAQDITRPGSQAEASFCSGEGISGREGISRECHLGLWTNCVHYFLRFVWFFLCVIFTFSGAFQFGRYGCSIDLFHNGGQIKYSSVLMLISLTSPATTSKFQKNICFKTRAVGPININTKECKSGLFFSLL